ncbi:argininosuccinate lyase [Anaeromassilibacillus senegalensis]|uniref:Argininosuccinate lyase n=1 Tax=Anaeromassilibacillus senegalensis TaxID=1673717 RepID=A0ABS9CRH1_9FIRM|nr:argininosuccinate lyase [Anaeromassilibacillus senegalensis]MCF2652564.1 argininosuccinate lyase [Anaeromassilibacillus senegalensis]
MKLWKGRFQKEADPKTNDFNSSISIDSRMYKEDIEGSIAHATMLGACGIIEQSESDKICAELEKIAADIESGALHIDPDAEDIHTFIEGELTSRIGDAGKRLHTARSRNDQVALDVRLTLRKECAGLVDQLKELISVLCDQAEQYADTVMPGYTHLQRAQPITFGHHLMAYAEMFLRDIGRMQDAVKRMDVCPLGSGALAGTTYPLDRDLTASLLGFSAVSRNSLDGVADRDFCAEIAAAVSLAMVHLSRFSEEIILWCSWEFKFIELDDAFSTGSSIMPQKKNPDITELIRGKSGRVFGDLMALLTMMKGLPLAYNKDMQEDKEAVFDAVDTLRLCLTPFIPMLQTMRVLKENMRNAAAKGFINATDCADYLVAAKGLPFRDAYKITGELVALCISRGLTLETLPLAEYKKVCDAFDEGVYAAINLEKCVNDRKVKGAPCPENVRAAAKEVRALLG